MDNNNICHDLALFFDIYITHQLLEILIDHSSRNIKKKEQVQPAATTPFKPLLSFAASGGATPNPPLRKCPPQQSNNYCSVHNSSLQQSDGYCSMHSSFGAAPSQQP
jgi:hypothetical protein